MEEENLLFTGAEWLANAIGYLGVTFIVGGSMLAVGKWLLGVSKGEVDLRAVRITLGTYILVGLEFMVGQDIIETVIEPDLHHLKSLGLIVMIRVVLEYFLGKEVEHLTHGDGHGTHAQRTSTTFFKRTAMIPLVRNSRKVIVLAMATALCVLGIAFAINSEDSENGIAWYEEGGGSEATEQGSEQGEESENEEGETKAAEEGAGEPESGKGHHRERGDEPRHDRRRWAKKHEHSLEPVNGRRRVLAGIDGATAHLMRNLDREGRLTSQVDLNGRSLSHRHRVSLEAAYLYSLTLRMRHGGGGKAKETLRRAVQHFKSHLKSTRNGLVFVSGKGAKDLIDVDLTAHGLAALVGVHRVSEGLASEALLAALGETLLRLQKSAGEEAGLRGTSSGSGLPALALALLFTVDRDSKWATVAVEGFGEQLEKRGPRADPWTILAGVELLRNHAALEISFERCETIFDQLGASARRLLMVRRERLGSRESRDSGALPVRVLESLIALYGVTPPSHELADVLHRAIDHYVTKLLKEQIDNGPTRGAFLALPATRPRPGATRLLRLDCGRTVAALAVLVRYGRRFDMLMDRRRARHGVHAQHGGSGAVLAATEMAAGGR